VQHDEIREGMNLAVTLALAGITATAGRMITIRRWFPQFNLPPRALLLGALIVIANVALPLIFRFRMKRTDSIGRKKTVSSGISSCR
jgi:hypothetical protein